MGYLGLNVGAHDSSACLLEDNGEVAIYLTERISKVKNAGYFPHASLLHAFNHNAKFFNALKNENIVATSFLLTPQALEKVFSEKWIPTIGELLNHLGLDRLLFKNNPQMNTATHHRCHAYSAVAFSPFESCLILVVDGAGSAIEAFSKDHPERSHFPQNLPKDVKFFETSSAYHWDGHKLATVKKKFSRHLSSPFEGVKVCDGLGNLFQSASQVIFGDWKQAGKVMGMSAYGKITKKIEDSEKFIQEFYAEEWTPRKGKKEFDEQPEEDFKRAVDLSATVQAYFMEQMWLKVSELKSLYPNEKNIVLVGGCALNCLFNSHLMKSGLFENVFVPPFPNDEGIALGAAWGKAYEDGQIKFKKKEWRELTAALGSPEHDTKKHESKIPQVFKNFKIQLSNSIEEEVAKLLEKGEVVAWLQGRSEVGPRALGHRSLLVRPDRKDVKKYLNNYVKFREDFRPYGAMVMLENVHDYVDVPQNTQMPFMTFAPQIKKEKKDVLAGVTHLDETCRIQTVDKNQNPRLHLLLEKFSQKTGVHVLLNTSLNIMGQPILEDVQDALKFFETAPAVKFMAYGNWLISKD
ncbi:MAG: hypothetical protein K2P81_13160 [Bacteriovoracaceae bacterium]|nr:hypothetical protein [Bacteriovoracaceae bacterium]